MKGGPLYVQYEHHGNMVWVREDLKGKHREICLCWACKKFHLNNPSADCKIARDTFENCQKHGLVTPVLECPEFDDERNPD